MCGPALFPGQVDAHVDGQPGAGRAVSQSPDGGLGPSWSGVGRPELCDQRTQVSDIRFQLTDRLPVGLGDCVGLSGALRGDEHQPEACQSLQGLVV